MAGILIASTVACDHAGCGNTVLADVPSPDSRRHVAVFTRDCGATTNLSTQVSVIASGRTLRGGGNVFVADADHGNALTDSGRGPWVAVSWRDAHTIEIRYDSAARVFKREAVYDDMELRFVAVARPLPRAREQPARWLTPVSEYIGNPWGVSGPCRSVVHHAVATTSGTHTAQSSDRLTSLARAGRRAQESEAKAVHQALYQ